MFLENLKLACAAIRANKMRSLLTMLGIIIGISSVISIVSIGDTMRSIIAAEYENIGKNMAMVYVGYNVDEFRDSDYFSTDSIDIIKDAFGDELSYIYIPNSTNDDAVYGRNKYKTQLSAVSEGYEKVEQIELVAGRLLNADDINDRKYNAILEEKTAEKIFGTANAVGKTFRTTVRNTTTDLTVVGVYRNKLSAFAQLMMSLDGSDTGEGMVPASILTYPNDLNWTFYVYPADDTDIASFKTRMTQVVANITGRTVEQISYYSASDEMTQIDSIMSILSLAVGAIAAISLIVGGIGIMNIMLVSVTERTREIGIRKSLGARTRDVKVQFLTESAILSALGGIIGIALGTGVVWLAAAIVGVTPVTRLSVVLLAFGFSALVGIFFGLYPASKAAKSDPIDALRYE